MKSRSILLLAAGLLAIGAVGTSTLHAQQQCTPRMVQDPTLNNLEHDAGYVTAAFGELGQVIQVGEEFGAGFETAVAGR